MGSCSPGTARGHRRASTTRNRSLLPRAISLLPASILTGDV